MEWFKDWFNTEYYHILYKNRDEKEAQEFIQILIQFLNLDKSKEILDLACGKGRHALYLNQMGFKVLGLDLSVQSIECAKRNENEKLHFAVHDMREVYAKNSFDVVFNLFTSFGYFNNKQDNRKVMESICTQLKPNGTLVIDFMNCKKAINQIIPNEVKNIDGIDFHINKKFENGFITKEINFFAKNKSFAYQEKVQAFSLEDFISVAKDLFTIKNIFGNYKLDNYDQDVSDRLILQFQKI